MPKTVSPERNAADNGSEGLGDDKRSGEEVEKKDAKDGEDIELSEERKDDQDIDINEDKEETERQQDDDNDKDETEGVQDNEVEDDENSSVHCEPESSDEDSVYNRVYKDLKGEQSLPEEETDMVIVICLLNV